VRSAWHVLRGRRMVPLQIQFEWLEYQQLFDDLLKRFGAQLARSAKAEKKRVAKLFDQPKQSEPTAAVPVGPTSKSELRARARELRNGTRNRLSHQLEAQLHEPGPPEESP
jgi:hypothetical protein